MLKTHSSTKSEISKPLSIQNLAHKLEILLSWIVWTSTILAKNSNSNPNWTQKTETLWTLPTNDSVLVKSQHHATSYHHRNEPVKLHHLALPAAQTNQPPTIYVNRFLRERRREIKERWWEKEYFFFFLTIVRSSDSLLLAWGGGGYMRVWLVWCEYSKGLEKIILN